MTMTNEEYQKRLDELKPAFIAYRNVELELVPKIISDDENHLFDDSLFFAAIINRSLNLSDGLQQLLKSRNLTSAGILLRSQIDNCMRIYAAFISGDSNEFFQDFYQGIPINKMKDQNGNNMSDVYLKCGLTKYDERLAPVYNTASGFVHLSTAAVSMILRKVDSSDTDDKKLLFTIGVPLNEESNQTLIEVAEVFLHFCYLQQQLLVKVAETYGAQKQRKNDSNS